MQKILSINKNKLIYKKSYKNLKQNKKIIDICW